MNTVSIVVPMYNESPVVDSFFDTVLQVTEGIKKTYADIRFEIIAVNDGSSDQTAEKLKEWNAKSPNIGIISLSRNFGQEPAVFAGLEKAFGDAVIVMDCDMQDPPDIIPNLIEKWLEGYDVVNVRRTKRSTDSAFKRDTAGMFYRLLNKLSHRLKFPHNVNNFRLVSRRVLDIILSMPERNKFYRGLVPYAGFKTAEVLTERRERLKGESKYNLKAMVKLAVEGITSVTTTPLYIALSAGITALLISTVSAIVLIIMRIAGAAANYTLFGVLTGICFFSGVMLISTGITAIYVAKMYSEVKARHFSIVDYFISPTDIESKPASDDNDDKKE